MTGPRRSTTVDELIGTWLPRQRWFAAKGGQDPVLASSGGLQVPHPPDPVPGAGGDVEVEIEVRFVTASVGGSRATYQVPLTYRRVPAEDLGHALIGVIDADDVPRWVYDGPHDPAFVRAWLGLVSRGTFAGGTGGRAIGVCQPGARPPAPDRPARVLSGEQSNTSVIVAADDDPEPVILKVFRVLQAGANPDVAITSTLTSAGCASIPGLTGWIEGEWVDPGGGLAHGHLTSISEFLPGGQDAWRLACLAVENGQPFVEQSRGIGQATAIVHEALARALPTVPAGSSALGELADHLHQRLAWALEAVPQLRGFEEAARATVAAVRGLPGLPRLQRIHGDLHLGQVLDAGQRGWVLLDFEGEPLRPLADRNRCDLALRDIAGMLRSFDYAARHTILGLDESDPRVAQANAWAEDCGTAFLDAYTAVSGHDPRENGVLLRALELDKALYEAVYETRNRPTWVQIPVCAIARLLPPAVPSSC
jgi:maltokinase